jgi:hypothetical protein
MSARASTQCVIRDTSRHSPQQDYFMIEGAPQCLVADQGMKKEIILQGLGRGHCRQPLARAAITT